MSDTRPADLLVQADNLIEREHLRRKVARLEQQLAETYERAAQLCDILAKVNGPAGRGAERCARAIRALKPTHAIEVATSQGTPPTPPTRVGAK